MTAFGRGLKPTRNLLVWAGLVSGFMGTAASIGGPPIALVYQKETGPRVRGTLNGYFLVGTAMSLAALFAVGHFGPPEVAWALVLVPGAVLGFLCSAPAARWMDAKQRRVRIGVLCVCALSGVLVIVRQLF
jgi:uncharacterized membrane protein YfcA